MAITKSHSRMVTNVADVVNVKDFGATGDGATEDISAIQAALNNKSLLEIRLF